jgi:hypothetical protein
VDSFSIAMSLFLIVTASVLLGTALPFALAKVQIDPAHAGSSIQVVMDVFGYRLPLCEVVFRVGCQSHKTTLACVVSPFRRFPIFLDDCLVRTQVCTVLIPLSCGRVFITCATCSAIMDTKPLRMLAAITLPDGKGG